jgi:hypothetical protein
MAKRAKKSSLPPAVGETFAMRLADGRYGACRVIREPRPDESHAAGYVVVAATAYLGDTPPPSIDHPDLRRLLVLNHHNHNNDVARLWLNDPPPPDTFTRIGMIEPDETERKLSCNSWSGWALLPYEVLRQWRWDHDRDALIADDAERRRQVEQRQAELARQRRDELSRMTYASFRKRKLFEGWTGYPPKKMIAASRKIMKETASKLEALGKDADRGQARAILRDCIVAFNELDEANDNWIETVEREDICQHFYELAHLAGFDDEPQLADEWRDW